MFVISLTPGGSRSCSNSKISNMFGIGPNVHCCERTSMKIFGHPVGQRLREHLGQNQLAVRLVASSVGNLRSVLGLARINRARLDTGVRENIGKNKRCFQVFPGVSRCFQVFPGYVRFEVNHGVFLVGSC